MGKNDEQVGEPVYVLVLKEQNIEKVALYLDNMKALGLYFDMVPGLTVDVLFVKVSICDNALKHFSKVYDIGNYDSKVIDMPYNYEPIFYAPFPTPASTIDRKKEGELTNAESIMIVHKVLESAKFGHDDADYGMSKLIRRGILLDGYPLHEGPITEMGYNDRSLLVRYWANVILVHKEQPLDLIQRYFGHEVAFYFAWLEYYNITFILPSLMGLLVFLMSMIKMSLFKMDEVYEICTDQSVFICPVCEHRQHCRFPRLSNFCSISQWTYIFDNYFTIAFAIYMSFVATLFLNLWRRKEYRLKLRWDFSSEFDESEGTIRPVYRETVKRMRENKFTGELEPYMHPVEAIARNTISLMVCLVIVVIMLFLLIVNLVIGIMFRGLVDEYGSKYLKENKLIYSVFLGSFIRVVYVRIMALFLGPLTLKLTNLENPRTQADYDNSVLYKRYVLAFTNNLVPLFYIAFFKSKLYTVPHKNNIFLKQDVCQPQSCIVPLCIQLTFLLTLRSFAGNLANFIIPRVKALSKKMFRIKDKSSRKLPQWEEEYFLEPCRRFFLTSEYSEMLVKYSMVTFFVAAFPLAPACALINNLVEARSDAYKLIKSHRRPVPVVKGSIGAWNGVLSIMTYLSVAINAFVMAFTSDFIPAQVYHFMDIGEAKHGYYNFTLSKYATKDYDKYQHLENEVDYCFYRGQYHWPDDAHPYELTRVFWMILTVRFIGVFIFEHVIYVCNGILSYLIPEVPHSVKKKMFWHEKLQEKERIVKSLDAQVGKKTPSTKLLKIDDIT